MEQVKRLGQTVRQHYEKLILIVALLLLAGVVAYLIKAKQDEQERVNAIPKGLERRSGNAVPPVSLASFEQTLKEATNPPALNFSGRHNLLNPVKWQQLRAGGPIIKVQTGKEVGVESFQVVKVSPLFLTIAFDRATISGTPPEEIVTGYHTLVTNELATVQSQRRMSLYVSPNATNKVFILSEVKGPSNAPTELIAILRDYNNEKISFAPGKPYTRPVGYEAELKYPLTGRTYTRLRKESAVDIDGEPYKVVDITPTTVVLSDDSNGKRYAIQQFAAP